MKILSLLTILFLTTIANAHPTERLVGAQCWLDDDPDFDSNQFDGGPVYGLTSYEVRQECIELAQLRFGKDGSAGLADIRVVSANQVTAHCWLDDDPDFDTNQFDGGTFFGSSTRAIRTQCQQAAKTRFGSDGSSGLTDISVNSVSTSLYEAKCWLDDDPDFDANQFDGGKVVAKSTVEMLAECQWMAQKKFGEQGSAGLEDVKTASGQIIQAQCWLDDDPDFDFNQFKGDITIGYSTFDLRQECQLAAESRFGEKASSGIDSIELK